MVLTMPLQCEMHRLLKLQCICGPAVTQLSLLAPLCRQRIMVLVSGRHLHFSLKLVPFHDAATAPVPTPVHTPPSGHIARVPLLLDRLAMITTLTPFLGSPADLSISRSAPPIGTAILSVSEKQYHEVAQRAPE